jgi:hypothetical protein
VAPYAAGPQHDEVKRGFGLLTKLFGWTWSEQARRLPSPDAVMHRTVFERFDLEAVQVYDELIPYRPVTLAQHNEFARFYVAGAPFPANSLESATALADDDLSPLFHPAMSRALVSFAVRPIFGPPEARVFHLLHADGLAAPS